MYRLKEVVGHRKLVIEPKIPACRIALGWVAKAVDDFSGAPVLTRQTNFEIIPAGDLRRAVATANQALLYT